MQKPIHGDSHCHPTDNPKELHRIPNCCIYPIVAMSCNQKDWEIVAATAKKYKKQVVPCFGIHPWHAHTIDDKNVWCKTLEKVLLSIPKSLVGEIGVDKKKVKNTSFEKQTKIFSKQFQLAAKLNRSVSIHVVGHWGWMFDFLKSWTGKTPKYIVFHSYSGSKEMIISLLRLPIANKFLFGLSYAISARKKNFKDSVQIIPNHQLLIESDLDNIRYSYEYLTRIVKIIADAKGTSTKNVSKLCHQNLCRVLR